MLGAMQHVPLHLFSDVFDALVTQQSDIVNAGRVASCLFQNRGAAS